MRLREALRKGTEFLQRGGLAPEEARRETRLILAHLSGLRPLEVYLYPEKEIPEERFESLLRERISGRPLAYLLGEVEFFGRSFRVPPGVFIPRPETEILVETFLKQEIPPGRILDLGTGSGVILVSILAERPDLTGVGIDLNPLALETARENALRHGVADRCRWIRGFWLDPLAPRPGFVALVSNPPYVAEEEWEELPPEVREHEPPEALRGGKNGLFYIRETLTRGWTYLLPGGQIFLELGYNQAVRVKALGERLGLKIRFVRDLQGIERIAVVNR